MRFLRSRGLLPPELRRTWAAVPGETLVRIGLVGAILETGTATSVARLMLGLNPMSWGSPVADAAPDA